MHLRPARYAAPRSINQFEEPSVEGREALARFEGGQQRKPSASASSTASLIDGSSSGNSFSNGSGSNYNHQVIRFTASGQSNSPASTFNGKLNGELNNNNNILLVSAAQHGDRSYNNPNDLPTADNVGRSKASVKIFMLGNNLKPSYSSSINITNTRNNNNNSAMNFSKLDKIKLMELSVINLVELSTMAAEDEKHKELALERAREALEGFNSLRIAVMAQDRAANSKSGSTTNNKNKSNTSNDLNETTEIALDESKVSVNIGATQPMTTGVSLYELSLMVNSNLAAQLANNGHFEESIELYTQLCKMAGSYGLNSNQATMVGSSSSSRSQHETRFLLYRFGINIGNIYYRMQEYQRALKYYRLTLDRLSVSSANRNMRVKIMHNIALTLLATSQLSDAATSLNLLLSDNLVPLSSNNDKPTATNPLLEVCNSNYHQFGLHLMICHHQRADLNSMIATLKILVKVGICQHYEQVFDLTNTTAAVTTPKQMKGDSNDGRASSSSSSSIVTVATNIVAPYAAVEGDSLADAHKRRPGGSDTQHIVDDILLGQNMVGAQTIKAVAVIAGKVSSFLGATKQTLNTTNKIMASKGLRDIETASADHERDANMMMDQFPNENRRLIATTAIASSMNVMGGVEADHKLRAITKLSTAEKSRQLMRLIQNDRLEMSIGNKHNQISRSIIMSCKLMLDLDNRIAQSNQPCGGQSGTSVFDFCLKLLATSECYKALVYELKANSASGMLAKKYKLDEAIILLKEMDLEQQVHKQHQHKDNTNKSTVKNTTTNRYNSSNNKNQHIMIHQSSMVATNCSLLNLLQCKTKSAIEHGNQALKKDKFNVQALINLANCHYQESELDAAESIYHQALLIDPNSWEANYNLAILSRNHGRPFNDLKESTKSMLIKYRQCFSSLIWHKMILSVIQFALIYHQSGLQQQSQAIISDLLSSSKQAPDVLLLASRLIDDSSSLTSKETPTKLSAINILQQANRDNPYHLPVAERLIALNIQSFNYEQARSLLCTCIINRPDRVKWYQMLAECYRRAADYNRAIATYKMALDAFPQDTSCLKALIKLTDELGLTAEKKNFSNRLERVSRRSNLNEGLLNVNREFV